MNTKQNLNTTKSEIFTAYNKLRAALKRSGNEKALQRLNKALGILQSKNYYEGEKANYHPTFESCGCKDWQYRFNKRRRYTGPCKHMLAAQMLGMIEARRRQHEITEWLQEQTVEYEQVYKV